MALSAVITSYNHAPYLRACIESALSQTRAPEEVIVVDDGSTDGSREIIESFGAAVCAVFQANRGTYAALNAGLAQTSGEWIALHNSDDLWKPDKLARQMGIAEAHPEAGLIHTGVAYIGADDQPLSDPPGADLSGQHWPVCAEMLPVMLRMMPVVISSVMVSRRALEAVGGFDERFLGMGDWDFCLRVSRTFPFGFADAPLTLVRKHAASAGVDPGRLPRDWADRDWRFLGRETMQEAAHHLFGKARRGEIGRAEAAHALACLATLHSWGHEVPLAREAYRLSARLRPLRVKTYLRCLMTFLPLRLRRRIR